MWTPESLSVNVSPFSFRARCRLQEKDSLNRLPPPSTRNARTIYPRCAAALKLKGTTKNKAVPFSFLLFPQKIDSRGNKFLLAHANKAGKVLFESVARPQPGASYIIKKKDTLCVSLDDVVAYLVGGSLKAIKLGEGVSLTKACA